MPTVAGYASGMTGTIEKGAVGSAIERFPAADGTELATRHWPVPQGRRPWATMLMVHGLGEHSGRYDHVAARLVEAGIHVRAYDQRGFGASGGRRAWVDRWSRFHDDLAEQLAATRTAAAGGPVVLYGHSLGGLVALGYALGDQPKPDALVLSAPALDADIPGWKRALARVLGVAAPTLAVRNALDMAVLSRDPEIGARYLADPLNHHFTTTRLGMEFIREQARCRGTLGRLKVPTLVIHGAADRLVPTDASAPLGDLPAVTRRTYPDLRHEMHNEPEWESVVDDVVGWLRERVGSR
jgi:alpha-beta hydrolase superfamily lysophospholipase